MFPCREPTVVCCNLPVHALLLCMYTKSIQQVASPRLTWQRSVNFSVHRTSPLRSSPLQSKWTNDTSVCNRLRSRRLRIPRRGSQFCPVLRQNKSPLFSSDGKPGRTNFALKSVASTAAFTAPAQRRQGRFRVLPSLLRRENQTFDNQQHNRFKINK